MNKYIHPDSKQYFAFNIWDLESAKAIMDAASKIHQTVILQTSMKVFEQLDKKELRVFVSNYSHKKGIHTYLHLDHCKDPLQIKEAIDYNWDSVMLDASEQPLSENIRLTNEVCESAKPKGVLVEAEVGHICRTEEDEETQNAGIADWKDILEFLHYTSTDMVAIAIGTSHGQYQGTPNLRYSLIETTQAHSNIPIVIHGGTGLSDETLTRLLSYKNVKKINFSTDVKQAYRQGIADGISKGYMEKKGFDPLKITALINDSLEHMAEKKMRLLRENDDHEDRSCIKYGDEKHPKYYL